MESVMDDQAEIFQIRQKLDRLTFLTNFLAWGNNIKLFLETTMTSQERSKRVRGQGMQV